jgi:hypothetical protein
MLKLDSQTIFCLLYSVGFAKLNITDEKLLKDLRNKKICKLSIILTEDTNPKKPKQPSNIYLLYIDILKENLKLKEYLKIILK